MTDGLVKRIVRRGKRMLRRLVEKPVVPMHERVIHLKARGEVRGAVLVAYVIEPFLLSPGEAISNSHTHDWETWRIVQTFLDRGFDVDVISYLNRGFSPKRPYSIFFAARTNFQRIAEQLPSECRKVVHLDTAHWLTNNNAAYQRLLAVRQRRGVALENIKMVEANWALEYADLATILGNVFTIDSYAYAGKPIHRIPISVPEVYPFPSEKDFDAVRRSFLWFGSSGFVHKGLDLVLEAFAGMPEFELTVCGPFDDEPAFLTAFDQELFHTPNIHAVGWVDVASREFQDICQRCVGLVYPTASEGGGGSAVTCMHAALVPIVSYEASVDVGEAGVILEDNSVETIRAVVRALASEPADQLYARSRAVWGFVRERHTRESFGQAFDAFVDEVLLDGCA
ncbi:MAG: glycosyltransferase [Pseudomonadales bacterium]|nr:glycosyltransferase [Pseudomonadales bacterium]